VSFERVEYDKSCHHGDGAAGQRCLGQHAHRKNHHAGHQTGQQTISNTTDPFKNETIRIDPLRKKNTSATPQLGRQNTQTQNK